MWRRVLEFLKEFADNFLGVIQYCSAMLCFICIICNFLLYGTPLIHIAYLSFIVFAITTVVGFIWEARR